jgi:membrane protease YdiL (CAAX protease family)
MRLRRERQLEEEPLNAIGRTIRAYPIVSFAVLACLFGWIFFIAAELGAGGPPGNLPLGPIIAAALVAIGLGRAEWRAWTRALRTFRSSIGWYILAILAPVVTIGAAVLTNHAFGAPLPSAAQLAEWTGLPVVFLFLLIFVGIGEEAGWTAFAAPRLLAAWPFVTAWVALSAIRILWHLPLMLAGSLPWVLGVVGNAAFQFLLLWIFLRSGGVWFLTAIWHAVHNVTGGEFLFQMVQGADAARLDLLVTIGYILLAVAVFLWDRRHLVRAIPATTQTSP